MTNFLYSLLLHFVIGVAVLVVVKLENKKTKNKPQTIKFKVIAKPLPTPLPTPVVVQPLVKPQKTIKKQPLPKKISKKKKQNKRKKKRKVFGVSKKSITSKKASAPLVKRGNTVATEVDQRQLRRDDAEELPIPVAEYLVTEMPAVLTAAKITYPQGMQLEGTVVLHVLIDKDGRVRAATVVEGLAQEMDSEALRAIKKYRFRPAKIDNVAVAVRIRYAIKFVLENN